MPLTYMHHNNITSRRPVGENIFAITTTLVFVFKCSTINRLTRKMTHCYHNNGDITSNLKKVQIFLRNNINKTFAHKSFCLHIYSFLISPLQSLDNQVLGASQEGALPLATVAAAGLAGNIHRLSPLFHSFKDT